MATEDHIVKALKHLNNMVTASTAMSILAKKEAAVDTQVIKQILVRKGICTEDEIKAETGRVLLFSPTVRELDRQLAEILLNLGFKPNTEDEAMNNVSSLFAKMASGTRLSDEEIDKLNESFKKYAESKED